MSRCSSEHRWRTLVLMDWTLVTSCQQRNWPGNTCGPPITCLPLITHTGSARMKPEGLSCHTFSRSTTSTFPLFLHSFTLHSQLIHSTQFHFMRHGWFPSRLPSRSRTRTTWPLITILTKQPQLEAEDVLPNINHKQAEERAENAIFLSLVTSTFKFVQARDQTHLPREFGANPFRGPQDISYTN